MSIFEYMDILVYHVQLLMSFHRETMNMTIPVRDRDRVVVGLVVVDVIVVIIIPRQKLRRMMMEICEFLVMELLWMGIGGFADNAVRQLSLLLLSEGALDEVMMTCLSVGCFKLSYHHSTEGRLLFRR